MSDQLSQDIILSVTILKACANCGHPRGVHEQDKECNIKGCTCQKFIE